MEDNNIRNGAFQIARQMFSSEIWTTKPSTWKVIWIYILGKVNHKDRGTFKRGEGFFNLTQEMRQMGSDITYNTVREAIRYFRSSDMIDTRKTTRGVIIKVNKYDIYQTLDNYQNKTENKVKTKQKQNGNTMINKNGKNVKNNTKVLDKSYGREDINEITVYLKEAINSSLDGSIGDNRKYSKLLIDKLKKDYPDYEPVKQIKYIIDFGLGDDFHSKNITSFKYIYYNCRKIINSIKDSRKTNFTVIG